MATGGAFMHMVPARVLLAARECLRWWASCDKPPLDRHPLRAFAPDPGCRSEIHVLTEA
jgi:hypothetical protein